jgi:hypothetical protein
MKYRNSIARRLQKALHKNKKGGIEGLPLQLMILIIIATLGTAIIVGWMGNIETPHAIGEVSVDSGDVHLKAVTGYYYGSSSYDNYTCGKIVIGVTDQDGNPLQGATVILTGLGAQTARGETVHGLTGSDGTVTFSDVRVHLDGKVGFITVNVSMSGYGEDSSCRITAYA